MVTPFLFFINKELLGKQWCMGAWIRKLWNSAKGIVLMAVVTILIVACLRVFLFASFAIPTSSMEPTILPGDHILVNKLIPGPRMDWLLSGGVGIEGGDYRIKGCRAVRHGDVLVFNAPYHHSDKMAKNMDIYYIKRCMGIPGDTLVIRGGNYLMKNGTDSLFISFPRDESADHSWIAHKTDMFKALDWTLTSFGPIYIPRKAETIRLDSINIHLYKKLIEYETGGKVTFDNNTSLLNDSRYPAHFFKHNYYFVAGDFRADSEDSRFWGLLPEDHIVGKAAYIWRSTDPKTKKHRFDRFLKPL
jgi:signal peptidase I